MNEEMLLHEMEINQRIFIRLGEISTTEKMMNERPSREFARLKFHTSWGVDDVLIRTQTFTIHEQHLELALKIKKRQDKIVKNYLDDLQQLKVHPNE